MFKKKEERQNEIIPTCGGQLLPIILLCSCQLQAASTSSQLGIRLCERVWSYSLSLLFRLLKDKYKQRVSLVLSRKNERERSPYVKVRDKVNQLSLQSSMGLSIERFIQLAQACLIAESVECPGDKRSTYC